MEEIAQVYARSLFDVASKQGTVEVVREQLGQLTEALETNKDLRLFCFSPYFSSEEKKRGLEAAISDADPSLERFLMVLVENERLPLIARIRREYDRLCDEAEDLLAVTVTSAVALDPGTTAKLVDQISEQTGSRVELTEKVDPAIVGGVVLRVGNSILDASIRNRLENLRTEVARA